ncbi:hypothetical protein SLNSH_14075 [Alsobacter soli]|uniref:Uncharacterized protein n=1 Tax=Alsobacter soli TaxID=2109933 RepID=A0A2T1HRR3_9HYPH|nr:hypothetical protein [Alsobacter soli]PSC04354.1 hypothetical protein SLNSH_14075 [Alsobacter soli]
MSGDPNLDMLAPVLMVVFMTPVGWAYLLLCFALGLARTRWFLMAPVALLGPALFLLFSDGFTGALAGILAGALAAALAPYALGRSLRALLRLTRAHTA